MSGHLRFSKCRIQHIVFVPVDSMCKILIARPQQLLFFEVTLRYFASPPFTEVGILGQRGLIRE